MSTTGTEKHCRLCLMLSKGGTKACQYLLMKHVKEKPRDPEQNEWTIASFLNSKRENIIKAKLSKEKYKVLFPDTGDTELSNWDLSLYCQVLTSYCGLKDLELMDIKQLRKTRNKLCHMNDAEIANLEFENKFEMIQAIIGRILEKVGDQDLKLEVETIIKHLESGPLSMDETLKEMRKFYLMEMDIHEKLDHVKEKVLETHEKLDHVDENVLETHEKLDHVEEIVLEKLEKLDDKYEIIKNKLDPWATSGIDSATNNVFVPGVDIFLDLKNVSDEEEENMCDILQQLFEEVINQNDDIKSSLLPNLYARLRTAVNKTFQLFLSKGWIIISAKHECIQLHIKCSNFKSLAALFREHTNGKIENHLTDLNEALTECVNGEKSYIQTIIYKGEFWNVLDKSISFVDRFLTELNIDVAKEDDNAQPLHKDRRATLSLTAQNLMSGSNKSFKGDCNNELRTCLQLLTSELESEFQAPHLSIQGSCSTNVNCEKDEIDLDGQDNMMQTIKSGDVENSKLCLEDKENSDRSQDEEYDKTAITQRSLKEIGPTKGAHEKGKYHSDEKKEITEQGLEKTTTQQTEFLNWIKGVTSLRVTKTALCNHIIATWKNELHSWDQEEISHLPDILIDIDRASLRYKKDSTGRKRWKIKCSCRLCQSIFDRLLSLQLNESERIVWNPVVQEDNTDDNINTEEMKEKDENQEAIPVGETQSGPIDEHYWHIANMYMFRGNETNRNPNSGPENTDAAIIFKMMKNCKLFKLKDESGDEVYDDLLEVRNFLMHSANHCMTEEALDICFDRMETLLHMEQFNDVHCQKAMIELSELRRLEINTLYFSDEDKIMISQALCVQKMALEFEMNVGGTLKDDRQLKRYLKKNEMKEKEYTEKDASNDIPTN